MSLKYYHLMSIRILILALIWAVIWTKIIHRCPQSEPFFGHPLYLGETQVPAYHLDYVDPRDRPAFGSRWRSQYRDPAYSSQIVRPGQGVPRYCGQCGDQSYAGCRSCADCGYCVHQGIGECVPGDERGPYFREDCEYWEYLPPRYYHTPRHHIFPTLRIRRRRRFRPRGWRFWNWYDPIEEVEVEEEEEITPSPVVGSVSE